MAALAAWLHATVNLSQQMHPAAAAATAAAAGTSSAMQQLYEYKGAAAGQAVAMLQQQQGVGWWLPLPRELAVAAAAAERWPAAAASAARSVSPGSLRAAAQLASCDELASTIDSLVAVDGGSIDVGGVALPTIPHLLHDAAYWERVFAALADDVLLLESVVASHGLAHVADAQQQQQQQLGLQREPAAVLLHDLAGEKQALHTVFDT
jgi:hypothetical protein